MHGYVWIDSVVLMFYFKKYSHFGVTSVGIAFWLILQHIQLNPTQK